MISPFKVQPLLDFFNRRKTIRRSSGVAQAAVFRYRFGFKRNGQTFFPTPWQNNLILDSGLNKVASVVWQDCWNTCLFGDAVSPTPVRRDSNAVTFTTVGTACTASGSFFVAQDVGRLIKFNDGGGQEAYITGFTSATLVTLGIAPSPAISGVNGTVWYVNETTLDSLYATTSTYQTNAGDNDTIAAANVITYKRTFLGVAVAGPVTLTEIGFNDSAANVSLFDRDIITGGVALITGDQPLAVAELILTMTPAVSTAVGNVGTGLDTTGNMIITGLNYNSIVGSISYVDSAGNTQSNSALALEPSIATSGGPRVVLSSFSLGSFSNGPGPALAGTAKDSYTNAAYSNGNFYRDSTATWNVATAVGTIFGWYLGQTGSNVWQHLLTTPFSKSSAQVLTITFRKSWQRILTN